MCFFVEWFAGLDSHYWGGGGPQAYPEATPTLVVVKMFFFNFHFQLLTVTCYVLLYDNLREV